MCSLFSQIDSEPLVAKDGSTCFPVPRNVSPKAFHIGVQSVPAKSGEVGELIWTFKGFSSHRHLLCL